jgi:UDP-2,4-diacetamido-2,4,6-trideoxy-beta-L-altropyranose hydrolase
MAAIRIAFRVDASNEIGAGHVMRCLILAEALRQQECNCIFICRNMDGNLIDYIENKNFEVIVLHNESKNANANANAKSETSFSEKWLRNTWERDARDTCTAIQKLEVSWLVVDHYGIDARWERIAREAGLRVMVIDDIVDRSHDCQFLLVPSISLDTEAVCQTAPNAGKILIGSQYIFIRPEFSDLKLQRQRSGEVNKILVYMGSNDGMNQAGKALEALKGIPDIEIKMLIGNSHPFEAELSAFQSDAIEITKTTPAMWDLMAWADLALGTCGQAAWERCAMGLPAIVVINAENQRRETVVLDSEGVVRSIGDARDVQTDDWFKTVMSLIDNPLDVRRMSEKALELSGNWKNAVPEIVNTLLSNW